MNGLVVRTLFPNNTIPQSRMDPVALKVQALIPSPTNGQNTLNWLPVIPTNTQQQIPSLKIDENLSDRDKLSFFWSRQSTNQVASPDGLPIPLTGARPKIVVGVSFASTSTAPFRRPWCCTSAALLSFPESGQLPARGIELRRGGTSRPGRQRFQSRGFPGAFEPGRQQ